MQNFPRYIWEHLQDDADAFCFRYLDEDKVVQPYSYREWTRHIQRVAVYLKEAGFEPGTRVGLVAPLNRGWLDLAFGTWLAGGVVVPINHELERDRTLKCLGRSGCDWIAVADAEARDHLRGQGEGLPPSLRWVLLDPESDSAGETVTALSDMDEEGRGLVARGRVDDLAESVFPLSAQSPAAILFDGEPSDDPHGALYNADTLQRMLEHLSVSLAATDEETTAVISELGRPAAFLITTAMAMKGSPIAVCDTPGGVRLQLDDLVPTRLVCSRGFLRQRTEKWREKLQQAPEFMQETNLDEAPDESSASSMGLDALMEKVGSSAAERLVYRPLRRSLGGDLESVLVLDGPLESSIEQIVEQAGPAVLNQFSLPECGISHLEHSAGRSTESLGQPIDGYRCKIDAGSQERGEILIQSDCLFDDYWDREGPRRIEDGWLRTGIEGEIVEGALRR